MNGFAAELRRTAGWHRRLLAAGLAAGSVALVVEAVEPPAQRTATVVVAARDLAGGTRLTQGVLTQVRLPPEAVPAGAARRRDDVVGRIVAGPVRAGEPLTDVRLVGPSLIEQWGPDVVATPVRIADPEAALLVEPGDRVDVLAAAVSPLATGGFDTGPGGDVGGPADIVARDVPVLAVPRAGEPPGLTEGALVLLATTPAEARQLAGAAVVSRLTITLRAS